MASSSLRLGAGRTDRAAWRSAAPEILFALASAVYLGLAAAAFLVFKPTTVLYFTDYWEHRAIVEEVIRHGIHLQDPIYAEAAPSRQFTPWSLALGYLARLAGIDSDGALAVGAMLVSVLFLAGMFDFGRTYFRRRWAPVLLLGMLTCCWGLTPLIWTGFYSLRAQLHGNYYPAAFTFALTFLAWAQVVRSLRGDRLRVGGAAWLAAIVLCTVVTHQLNAALLLAGAVGFLLFEPVVAPSRRAAIGLVIVGATALSGLWPYFNPLSTVGLGVARGQDTFNNFPFFFSPIFITWQLWPALPGLFAVSRLYDDRRSRLLVVGLLAITGAFCLGGWADVSVSHRFLAYVALALHLIVVQALLDRIDRRPDTRPARRFPNARTIAAIGCAVVLVTVQVGLAAEQLATPWAHTFYHSTTHPVGAESRQASATLPPGSRILGWDSAALLMPAFGVHVASFPRPMPFSPTDPERQADYRRFFSAGVPVAERLTIADRWGATHVAFLATELAPDVQTEIVQMGPVQSPAGPWRIIALARP